MLNLHTVAGIEHESDRIGSARSKRRRELAQPLSHVGDRQVYRGRNGKTRAGKQSADGTCILDRGLERRQMLVGTVADDERHAAFRRLRAAFKRNYRRAAEHTEKFAPPHVAPRAKEKAS